MTRGDDGLAFLLKYENVAWYEDGCVRILDRRKYPSAVEYVRCERHEEVARAIADMVTQSGGPYVAAAMGMALAARESRGRPAAARLQYLRSAARTLAGARPTTAVRMAGIVEDCLSAASRALQGDSDPEEAIFDRALSMLEERYRKGAAVARHFADKLPPGGTMMTQCFGETYVGAILRECRDRGNEIKVICPETRPYFQGARLTAAVAADMGFDVTVITDNMPAHVLKARKVDVFTSAADVICMDGHIVNKIGTFQIALAARYWGVPYFVTGVPNRGHPTIGSVEIEEREGREVLEAMGMRTAAMGAKGYYPAFDVTPPSLCDGVVTDKGIFAPLDLASYFSGDRGIAALAAASEAAGGEGRDHGL